MPAPKEVPPAVQLDLRGVPCPVNWAKTKARLAALAPGTLLEVFVDDPRSETDLPRAAEMDGHAVIEVRRLDGVVKIVIET